VQDPTTTNQLYHRTLKKYVLDQTKYPEAVCNDGSSAAYFFDVASDVSATHLKALSSISLYLCTHTVSSWDNFELATLT
jgi:hypothetical protein